MSDSPLFSKSKNFALRCRRICDGLQKTRHEFCYTDQLIRSSSSIGANIREAFAGHSRADFIAKLQIALKECSESEYWLELLIESGYCDDQQALGMCIELKRLLTASLNTAKNKAQ